MIIRLAAALAAVSLVAATAPAEQRVSFDVGAVKLAMPVPAGFCPPTGPLIALAQTIAAADTVNVTLQTLYRCDATPTNMGDYTLIKTPIRTLSLAIDRPALLAAIAPDFDKPSAIDPKKLNDDAADALSRTTGAKTTIALKIDVRGHDTVCGYLGGHGMVSIGTESKDIVVGGCITSVGGRLIQVFRYTDYRSDRDIDRMMKEARALALTIAPVGA